MTQDELIKRIQILIPKANLSVWNISGDYYGDRDPIERCGFRICWSPLNVILCPEEEAILSVTQDQINSLIEKEQDDNLYNQYKDSVFMKALYSQQKQQNPQLSFLEFLKINQNTEV